MKKRAAALSTVVLLGLAGTAGAQSNQYDSPTVQGGAVGGAQGAGAVQQADGALPFTGFQAAIALLGGAGVAATGFALRRVGRNRQI